jgi:regulator of extracellular matrix RemA (YlzA/DUF370 family)
MALSEILHLGHGAYVVVKGNVEAILDDEGNGIRALREQAEQAGRLFDVRRGHAGKAIVIMMSGHVYWSAVTAATLVERLRATEPGEGG